MKNKEKKKELKTERLCFRVSKSELRKLKRISQKYNISITEFMINSALHTPNDYRNELKFIRAMAQFQSLINEIQDGTISIYDYEKCQDEVDRIWKIL